MTPYLEVRPLPASGRRRWLVALGVALLVVPVGALLPGGATEPHSRALAIAAVLALSPLIGLGLARPRQLLTVDAQTGTISCRTTGALPDPRARESRWPISQARTAVLEERGTPTSPTWGVRLELEGEAPLHLRAYADRDLAQDTVDHLVLLGIPGHSRAAARERALSAEPPVSWL